MVKNYKAMFKFVILLTLNVLSHQSNSSGDDDTCKFKEPHFDLKDYEYFSENDRLHMKDKVKEMFYFGYDNYMKHAFPLDELNPIHCSGRGPDKERP